MQPPQHLWPPLRSVWCSSKKVNRIYRKSSVSPVSRSATTRSTAPRQSPTWPAPAWRRLGNNSASPRLGGRHQATGVKRGHPNCQVRQRLTSTGNPQLGSGPSPRQHCGCVHGILHSDGSRAELPSGGPYSSASIRSFAPCPLLTTLVGWSLTPRRSSGKEMEPGRLGRW
jgi:hypothetical protein